ncbi:hypothetical protein CaCOL14_000319 [Colletotrichum acutatum]
MVFVFEVSLEYRSFFAPTSSESVAEIPKLACALNRTDISSVPALRNHRSGRNMIPGLHKKFTWGPSRTNTNDAAQQGSANSATPQQLQRSQTMPKPPSGWVPEQVMAYNLRWDKLREWLMKRFENDIDISAIGGGFSEKKHLRGDRYYFHTPQRLTKQDMDAIDGLRERNPNDVMRQEQRIRYSPDPEEQTTDNHEWESD